MINSARLLNNVSIQINDKLLFKSNNSTPRLPNIKTKFQEQIKTPLSVKIETNNKSNILKRKYIKKILQPSFDTPQKLINDFFMSNNKIKIKRIKSNIRKSASSLMIVPKKIPNLRIFHQNLKSYNQKVCNKSLLESYKKYEDERRHPLKEILYYSSENKKFNTGIFGPSDNIVSIIRARMERLKYDNFYKGVEPELKEIIKDEIMEAQVRLKRKPNLLIKKKFNIRPLYLKRLDQYKYLSKMNTIREINQLSNTPAIVKDGQIMFKLIDETFNLCRQNKEKK
jgi:hypothetical protein